MVCAPRAKCTIGSVAGYILPKANGINTFLDRLTEPLMVCLPFGDTVGVPRCLWVFMPCTGEPIANTYGGKPVLNFLDAARQCLPELAILVELRKAGWDGMWVDTERNKFGQAFDPHCCAPSEKQAGR
jgi:hypothetical protein